MRRFSRWISKAQQIQTMGYMEAGAAAAGFAVAGPVGALAGMTLQQLIESGQAKSKAPTGEG